MQYKGQGYISPVTTAKPHTDISKVHGKETIRTSRLPLMTHAYPYQSIYFPIFGFGLQLWLYISKENSICVKNRPPHFTFHFCPQINPNDGTIYLI